MNKCPVVRTNDCNTIVLCENKLIQIPIKNCKETFVNLRCENGIYKVCQDKENVAKKPKRNSKVKRNSKISDE